MHANNASPTMTPPQSGRFVTIVRAADGLLLPGILLFAGVLRLYHLETPSMWWDEILVPMTANHPLGYIFEWARRLEVNSPYYVVLVKGLLALGDSDFCLRLPSALAGIVAVWAVARTGTRLAGRATGLFAALLLAAWPLHVLLSRQVRPYALFALVLIPAMERVFFLVEARRVGTRDLLELGLCYTALYALHFMAVPVILSHCVFVLAAVLLLREVRLDRAWRFAMTAVAGFACIAPFFVGTFLQRKDMLGAGGNLAGELARLAAAVHHVVWPLVGESPLDYILPPTAFSVAWGGTFLVLVAGACAMVWRRRPALGLFYAASLFVPLLLFLALRQPVWRPRHLSFLLPPLALLFGEAAGAGMAALRAWGKAAARAVPILACLVTFAAAVGHPDQLYGPQSYPDVYKSQARELNGLLAAGEPVFADNPGDFNAVAWYLRRFRDRNPLEYQALGTGRTVALRFLVPEHYATSDPAQRKLLERLGPPERVELLSKGAVYTYRWERAPATLLAPGLEAAFSAAPWIFYRGVAAMADLTAHWADVPFVHPARNAVPAWFEKDFHLERVEGGALVEGEIDFLCEGVGNMLEGDLRVNGEETARRFFRISGSSDVHQGRFKYVTSGEAVDIGLRVVMRCARRTPLYAGGNLETVGFRGVRLRVVSLARLRFGSASLVETFSGLDPVEETPEGAFRWGHGPRTSCTFRADRGEVVRLDFAFTNVLPGQTVRVLFNGRDVTAYEELPSQKWLRETMAKTLELPAVQGENRIDFEYTAYNGQKPATTFAPRDTRPLAVAFTRLRVERVDGAPANGLLR